MKTMTLAGTAVALFFQAGVSLAAPPAPAASPPKNNSAAYKAMGAPADPKVRVRWNRYHDFAESSRLLKELVRAYPGQARLESLGKSYGDRELWVMTISDDVSQGRERHKPAMWIDGGIHANEIQSVEVVLYTAWYLLEMQQESETVRRLLRERVFYLAPMLSPDARDAHFHSASTTHSPRTGLRPVDDDHDGLFNEDGPKDLDGDGQITQMRVRDPNGKYKEDPQYPGRMIEVKEGERGEYTLLGDEGYDSDGDGLINEDGPGGYDPNRNWGWKWEPEYIQAGSHRYPFSIYEDRVFADFIADHPNIVGAQSYHNAGGMILRGPGAKDDSYEPADDQVLLSISRRGEELLPRYRAMKISTELYEVHGGELDWLYHMHGVFGLTNEMFTPSDFFGTDDAHGHWVAGDETTRKFDKYLLLGEGYVPWHKVKHPQYGDIEVGGIKKNWGRQPASFLIEEGSHRNMAFSLYHADQLPLVRVQAIDVRPLDPKSPDGLTQVTAIIENQRFVPTHAAMDVKRRISPPDMVSLSSKTGRVVYAQWSDNQFFESATPQKRHPERVEVESIPGNSVVYVRWLADGPGPFVVKVKSAKGGSDTKDTRAAAGSSRR